MGKGKGKNETPSSSILGFSNIVIISVIVSTITIITYPEFAIDVFIIHTILVIIVSIIQLIKAYLDNNK